MLCGAPGRDVLLASSKVKVLPAGAAGVDVEGVAILLVAKLNEMMIWYEVIETIFLHYCIKDTLMVKVVVEYKDQSYKDYDLNLKTPLAHHLQ